MTEPIEWMFSAADDVRLFVSSRLPAGRPARAHIVVTHGIFEHGGRHRFLAESLTAHGYAVHCWDLRGHGRSEGRRASIDRFEQYLHDLARLLNEIDQRFSPKSLFLFGHSMGGQIVLLDAIARGAARTMQGFVSPRLSSVVSEDRIRSARIRSQSQQFVRSFADCRKTICDEFFDRQERTVCGVIASAPNVRPGAALFPSLRVLARPLSWIAPRLRLVRMGGRNLSRDPQVIDAFRNDPLVYHDRFEVRIGAEALRAGRLIRRLAVLMEAPMLVIHGTDDVVADPQGSRELIESAQSVDKTLKLYQGLKHECLSEPEREHVLADIVEWLDHRT